MYHQHPHHAALFWSSLAALGKINQQQQQQQQDSSSGRTAVTLAVFTSAQRADFYSWRERERGKKCVRVFYTAVAPAVVNPRTPDIRPIETFSTRRLIVLTRAVRKRA